MNNEDELNSNLIERTHSVGREQTKSTRLIKKNLKRREFVKKIPTEVSSFSDLKKKLEIQKQN